MSEQQQRQQEQAKHGWLARWRENRGARPKRAFGRAIGDRHSTPGGHSTSGSWFGFGGGDGGGWGGGDGGGGGGDGGGGGC